MIHPLEVCRAGPRRRRIGALGAQAHKTREQMRRKLKFGRLGSAQTQVSGAASAAKVRVEAARPNIARTQGSTGTSWSARLPIRGHLPSGGRVASMDHELGASVTLSHPASSPASLAPKCESKSGMHPQNRRCTYNHDSQLLDPEI